MLNNRFKYLSGKVQIVEDGFKSNPQLVDKGVPQGSILGLLQFTPYIIEIGVGGADEFSRSKIPACVVLLTKITEIPR